MTISWVGKNIECVAADTKPAAALVPANTLATETDTHNEYINNGTAWVLYRAASKTETLTNKLAWYATNGLGIGAFKQVISQSGSNIITRAATGGLILSSTVPEEAFQAALDLGGGTYVMGGGVYNFSAGFTGLKMIKNNTHLMLDSDAYLRVPNGFTGAAITIGGSTATGNVKNCTVQGGRLSEQGGPTEQRLWTGVSLETHPLGGVYFATVRNMEIITAGKGIRLYNHHNSMAVNSCHFENINCLYPDIGFDFDSTWPTTDSGMGHHTFLNCTTQTGAGGYAQTYGFKDICDGPVTLINCCAWDMTAGKTATIKSTGSQIKIIGGIIDRAGYFDDNSTLGNTTILQGHAGTFKIVMNNTNFLYGKDTAGTPVPLINIGTNDYINIGTTSDANIEGIGLSPGGAGTPFLISRASPTMQCGGVTRRVNITESGLTAQRTFTFPDATVKLIGENAVMTENANIVLSSGTGNKIGTATTQKLGFFNKAPIVQPTAITSPAADVASLKTAVDALRTALTNLGLTA